MVIMGSYSSSTYFYWAVSGITLIINFCLLLLVQLLVQFFFFLNQSMGFSLHSRFLYVYCNQGCSESTSSVAFEVLIIKSEIDFINLFIFNCLTSNVNLFIFNCLTSNINLFNFNCLTSNFCFPKNIFFASRRERMFMDAHL